MSSHGALTLGTAGHIDHGKTALIAALTGVDTDRLPEEHARGISIELGYAGLRLASGRHLSVIDVPGHERFVRTMVAGATGIDAYLMVIAADDGVMPQTLEHAAVLGALDVRAGVVAVTKSDVADPARALAEARGLLGDAEAVAVSVRTGAGMDGLTRALERLVADRPGRAEIPGGVCLHVDRAFTVRGTGTVVTGTLWRGTVGRGDEVVLLPAGRRLRVRGVQVHDRPVPSAAAGQRVALALAGVAVSDVARGDVVAAPDAGLAATYRIDAALEFPDRARTPGHGDRVQVHHGTRDAPARLAELGGRFYQLRLESPLVPAPGDRLVVRRVAPPDTLGGGVVLDAHPDRHGPGREVTARLTRRARGEPDPAPAGRRRSARPPRAPADSPVPRALSPAARALVARLRTAGFEPPAESELAPEEACELGALRETGQAVRVGRVLHYHPDALADVESRLVSVLEREGSISLAELRDELDTSRKFAQALLEHFDGVRLTRRLPDDRRVLRRRT